MPLLLPLLMIALGGAGLVVLRSNQLVLAAFALQWLGLVLAGVERSPATSRTVLGLTPWGAAELLTAAVCVATFGLTLRSLGAAAGDGAAGGSGAYSMADYLLPLSAMLLVGLAGVGFAALFPLGELPMLDLAIYWTALMNALALVLEGARNPGKLALGLLGTLNAASLLVDTLSITTPGAALLGLMSASRIALAALMAYGWLLLAAVFEEFSLTPLFSARDVAQPPVHKLAPPQIVALPGPGSASEGDAPADA